MKKENHIATKNQPSLLGLDALQVWDTALAYAHLRRLGEAGTKRTAERKLNALGLLPSALTAQQLQDEFNRTTNPLLLDWALREARRRRSRVLFMQLGLLPNSKPCLHANDARGARFWLPLEATGDDAIAQALLKLQQHVGKEITIFGHGTLVVTLRRLTAPAGVTIYPQVYAPILPQNLTPKTSKRSSHKPPYLKQLEAQSIHLLREAAAGAQNPAMLYSAGKNSCVMLHLARKAFYPALPPFPVLHIDTHWEFQEMYLFRDFMARASNMRLIIHAHPKTIEKNISLFDRDFESYIRATKIEGLEQALERHGFDVIFSGMRSDKKNTYARECTFGIHSYRQKNQHSELWQFHGTHKHSDGNICVSPLSGWTERDIWQYIYQEDIPVVPLYFAKLRPVIKRNGVLLPVDDARCKLMENEKIQLREVRFPTLDCYPLTVAIPSQATTLEQVLLETVNACQFERQRHEIGSGITSPTKKKTQKDYC